MPRPPSAQPTDGELEILQALWDYGPLELGRLHEQLAATRQVALTTVATMLTVMLAKGLVSRTRKSRGWVWSAKVSRESAARPIVRKLVDRVFDGSALRLVSHLLEHESLSSAEREELRELLSSQRTPRRARPQSSESPGETD